MATADVSKTVEIIFGATDQASATLRSIGGELDRFETNLTRVTGPLASATDALLKFEAVLAAVAAGGLVYAASKAIELESAWIDLSKVTGQTREELAPLEDDLRSIAREWGVTTAAAVDAAGIFVQAGFSIQDSITLAEQALIATKVSTLDAESAAQFFVATINSLGGTAQDAAYYLDVLNKTESVAGANIAALAEGFTVLAPAASLAGLSFEQMNALLAVLIERGFAGAEAGNALKTILARLGTDTAPVVQSLIDLGVVTEASADEFRSAEAVLLKLAEIWPTLTDEQKAFYSAEIAGINQTSKFSAVLEGFADVNRIVASASSAAGSAVQEAALRMAAAEESINALKASFVDAAAAIGEQFLPETTGIVNAFTDINRAIEDAARSGAFDDFFSALEPLFLEFEADLQAIAKNIPAAFEGLDWQPIIDGLYSLKDAFGGLFDGIDLTTPDGLRAAFQGLIDVTGGLLETTGSIVTAFGPLLDVIGTAIGAFADLDPEVQRAVGSFLGWSKVLDVILPSLSSLGLAFIGLGGALKQIVALGSGITSLFTTMGGAAGLVKVIGPLGLAGAVIGLVYALGEWTGLNDKVADTIVDLWNGVTGLEDGYRDLEFALADQEQRFLEYDATLKGLRATKESLLSVLAGNIDRTDEFARSEEQLADEAEAVRIALEKQGLIVKKTADGYLAAYKNADELAEKLTKIENATNGFSTEVRDADGNLVKLDGTFSAISKNIETTKDSTDKAKQELDEFRQKALELASDERIANIEASVAINVAQVEADAKKTVAAFESIGVSIQSQNELLASMFETWADLDAFSDKWQFEDWIEQQLDLQEKLINKQIAMIDATISQMKDTDGTIKISADGLDEDLKQFMYKILNRIQLEMSGSPAEFLLGLKSVQIA